MQPPRAPAELADPPDSTGPEPTPAVRAEQIVELSAVDVTPRARRRDLPRYPSRARRTGQQGVVELSLLIDERGEVADVALIRDDAGEDLTRETLSVVRGWTFSPARKDRQPVKVRQDVAIEFTILPDRSTSVRIRE
jgi:protein TonB